MRDRDSRRSTGRGKMEPMRARSIGLAGCLLVVACAGTRPTYRSLHLIDGQEVHSRPVAAFAYEAYLRARLALERNPPGLQEAQTYIETALQYDPRDPQLWTTRAEIAAQFGDSGAAQLAVDRALELSPGYAPAAALTGRIAPSGQSSVAR